MPGLAGARHARWLLAGAGGGWRARLFNLPLIAVTGSNGKTTVTQMMAAILRAWHG
jgi:UDP-N-acetylmuramyl pentapeptide synthase